jgi:hypothetical protein
MDTPFFHFHGTSCLLLRNLLSRQVIEFFGNFSINYEAGLISSFNAPELIEKLQVFPKFFQKEVFFDLIRQVVFIHQSGPSGEMKGI